MKSLHNALRSQFLNYFTEHGHTEVASSALVPQGDPSLMFVNAGMVQFKDVFVGLEKRAYDRAVSCQKCMRVSGKHNDLEEVGRTKRHHTLFEMLGNFSFGDYFKEEAIHMAWAFINKELQLDPNKIWITVFGGNSQVPADTEARALWRKISGLPEHRILDKDEKDNFWTMGDVGPCGPCTEIHIDQGSGPVTEADFDSGRVMEIWNNVFMQYSRSADGVMKPLPKPAVDTGMGLERVAALVAGVDSNYHTDIFMPLIDTVAHRLGKPYGKSDHEDDVSMRVIADHARALTFLVADGIQPSNEGRGYVLRRIMRRAIRHGRRLGFKDVFLPEVAQVVVDTMGQAYPELTRAAALIGKVAQNEEESFRHTLDGGLKMLSEALGGTLDRVAQGPKPVLSGEMVFKLYDTYGFPKDLTQVIAEERGIDVDHAGFDAAMAEQQARSRAQSQASRGAGQEIYHNLVNKHGASLFEGYDHALEVGKAPTLGQGDAAVVRAKDGFVERRCTITALVAEHEATDTLTAGQEGQMLLDATPLYAEGGGQVGDVGRVNDLAGTKLAQVTGTTRPLPELNMATVKVTHGKLQVGDQVWVGYEARTRLQTRAHHSATHLLHHALHKVLGDHVKQAGSLVDSTHLRFDFSHFSALTNDETQAIEDAVNRDIEAQTPITIEELHIDEARSKGAVALFGEKYGEQVRVISMGESIEFCGGTHAHNTDDLGLLLLTREQAVQSGVRRIEAEVGDAASMRVAVCRARLAQVAQAFGAAHLSQSLAGDAAAPASYNPAKDEELQQVVQLVERSLGKIAEMSAALADGEAPVPVTTPQALGLSGYTTPQGTKLAQARPLRDTWSALIQLAQGRAQDGAAILARLGKRDVGHLAAAVVNLMASHKEAERAMQSLRSRGQATDAKELVTKAKTLPGGIRLLTHTCEEDTVDLKALADHLRQAMGSGVVALAHAVQGRVTLLVAITPDCVGKHTAGGLIRSIASHVDGKGGGKADMAQAGGRKPEGVPDAFRALEALLTAS